MLKRINEFEMSERNKIRNESGNGQTDRWTDLDGMTGKCLADGWTYEGRKK